MSDYTLLHFALPKQHALKDVKKTLRKLWDAWGIKPMMDSRGNTYYELTISELRLSECTDILDELKDKYGLSFYVEYGVY